MKTIKIQLFVRKRHAQVRQREKRKKGMEETKADWGERRREGDFVLGWCWHYT